MVREIQFIVLVTIAAFTSSHLRKPNVCEKEITIVKLINPEEWMAYWREFEHSISMQCYLSCYSIYRRISTKAEKKSKILTCCTGYEEYSDNTCKPKCVQNCDHGICIAPNKCQCFKGWSGENCSSACPKDKWGPGCNSDCKCRNGAMCDPIAGTCACSKGWKGRHCDEPCSKHHYGYFCEEECKCENNALCDHVSGRCNCTAGYQGPFCREKCPKDSHSYQCSQKCKCQNNAVCHHEDGSCKCTAGWTGPICADRCRDGHFGINCSGICNCYNNGDCDFITGQCTCAAGFYGESCEVTCSPGTWGLNCSQKCNCTNGECITIDGSCNCFPGFIGLNCQDRACPSRMWGQNCSNECNCNHEMECHPATGECWCSPQWTGEDCSLRLKGISQNLIKKEENCEGDNTWMIAFAVSNSVMLLLLTVMGVMYYRKCIPRLNKIEDETLVASYSELIKEEHQ